MASSGAFRRALEDCDIRGVRGMWREIAPGLPQPESDDEALPIIHRARTEARSIAFRFRAYSHAWLLDRGLPSGLPDELRPRAERLYPRLIEAVGIAVIAIDPAHCALALAVRGAMSDAIAEAYADGRTDPRFLKSRMAEARRRVLHMD